MKQCTIPAGNSVDVGAQGPGSQAWAPGRRRPFPLRRVRRLCGDQQSRRRRRPGSTPAAGTPGQAPGRTANHPLDAVEPGAARRVRAMPGDVLGVYVEGFLGDRNQPLPVYVGPQVQLGGRVSALPGSGLPVPAQADGTIELPQVGALQVSGLSLVQAAAVIRKVYTDKQSVESGHRPGPDVPPQPPPAACPRAASGGREPDHRAGRDNQQHQARNGARDRPPGLRN